MKVWKESSRCLLALALVLNTIDILYIEGKPLMPIVVIALAGGIFSAYKALKA